MHLKNYFKSMMAGAIGSLAHTTLMLAKSKLGLMPTFQPYLDMQTYLTGLIGSDVPVIVPWALTFINGSVVLGFLFSIMYKLLPGRHGYSKGFAFGIMGWVMMGLFFFPMMGYGIFASGTNMNLMPALFSLLMILTYSITLGLAYSLLTPRLHNFY